MTRNVRLSDVTIALDDVGEGAPVLLLHGFPSTRHLWSRVAPLLVDFGFRVLVPDLVGYGRSDAPAEVRVDMASQARWMLELLDALGVAQATVVAHDVGSAAAQLMVVNTPQRVRGLVVLDGVYKDEWAMGAIASIQTWNTSDANRLLPVLARRFGKKEAMREMLAAYEGQEGGLRLIRATRDLDPRQTEHIGDALHASDVPALVLWGERDEFLPVDTVARPLAELLRAPLTLLPGGHFTPIDCPEEVASALRDFLLRTP
jgi:pimeloyl-ACP methyl ester carboxylesterase